MTLTKLMKFDDGVLDVLKSMDWQNDGTLGIITGGQLERKLYVDVNKALEVMGGIWNRKAKGHVFAVDPRPQVDGLLESGSLTVERDGFFETPPAVIEGMLELVPFEKEDDEPVWYLEPSAGLGAIARILAKQNPAIHMIVIEKNRQRFDKLSEEFIGICEDFLQYSSLIMFHRIYMNPPFEEGQDIDHVRHAYNLLQIDGAMVSVMSEGPFFRNDKKAVQFREWLDSVGGESCILPADSFEASGTGVNTRLVVIHK